MIMKARLACFVVVAISIFLREWTCGNYVLCPQHRPLQDIISYDGAIIKDLRFIFFSIMDFSPIMDFIDHFPLL